MGFCHFDYMQSEEWEVVRDIVLRLNNYECCVCGRQSRYNECHHETYKNVGKPQEINDCVVVCRTHHQGLHDTMKYLKGKK